MTSDRDLLRSGFRRGVLTCPGSLAGTDRRHSGILPPQRCETRPAQTGRPQAEGAATRGRRGGRVRNENLKNERLWR